MHFASGTPPPNPELCKERHLITREPYPSKPPQVLQSSNTLKMTGTNLLNHMELSAWVFKDTRKRATLAMCLSWLEHCPVHQKVPGSVPTRAHAQVAYLVPGQDVLEGAGYQWMFLSHSVFSCLSPLSL